MDRRKYIKDTILQLPLLLAATSILAGCKADQIKPNDKTIVIIGAGISGLAAAEKLNSLGFKVIILEAQEKIGGRLRTNRTLDIAFDEGASWIHGIDGNPIFTLANKAVIYTFETKDVSLKNYDYGGKERSSGIYQKAENELYEICVLLMLK